MERLIAPREAALATWAAVRARKHFRCGFGAHLEGSSGGGMGHVVEPGVVDSGYLREHKITLEPGPACSAAMVFPALCTTIVDLEQSV